MKDDKLVTHVVDDNATSDGDIVFYVVIGVIFVGLAAFAFMFG